MKQHVIINVKAMLVSVFIVMGISSFNGCNNTPKATSTTVAKDGIESKDDLIAFIEEQKRLDDSICRIQIKLLKDTLATVNERRQYLQEVGNLLARRVLTYRMMCIQIRRYADIVKANPSQIVFFRGWIIRATEPFMDSVTIRRMIDSARLSVK